MSPKKEKKLFPGIGDVIIDSLSDEDAIYVTKHLGVDVITSAAKIAEGKEFHDAIAAKDLTKIEKAMEHPDSTIMEHPDSTIWMGEGVDRKTSPRRISIEVPPKDCAVIIWPNGSISRLRSASLRKVDSFIEVSGVEGYDYPPEEEKKEPNTFMEDLKNL